MFAVPTNWSGALFRESYQMFIRLRNEENREKPQKKQQ
jgi:hypothetical protein